MDSQVLILFVIVVVVFAIISKVSTTLTKNKGVLSSDGHYVPKSQDLTCTTTDGHYHEEMDSSEFGQRYIVHNDPEEGYVVLNGIKRRITDCKNL